MNARFMLDRARPFAGELALICLVTLLSAATTLAVPWLAGQFLGGLLEGSGVGFQRTLGLLVLALVVMTGLNVVVTILSELASGRILAGLRLEAYRHVQSMPVSAHEQADLGDLLALVTYEVKILSNFMANTLATIPSNLATAAGAFVLLVLIDPTLGLLVPLLIPAFVVLFKLMGRRLKLLARHARHAEVEVFSQAEADLEMLSAIKSFAQEDHYRAQYARNLETARRSSLAQARASVVIGPVFGLLAALAAIAILVVSAGGIAGAQDRSAGELFSFLLYAALLTRPAANLARVYGEFQWASGTLERLGEVLTSPSEVGYAVPQNPEPTEARARGTIAFEGVGFSYPGRQPVLEGIDLAIAAGEVVALTGANGVGKSTLVRLLLRFYEPQAGRITLDGVDIRDINVQHLRRQIGYVPQRALLFNATLADNISMRAPGAEHAQVEQAARLSGAWDFIADLPDGLDTLIGDNGIRLSGGQRQRIALARALFADPPIYVFDEATSMYDMPSEATFIDTCVESLAGRTIILITHRPATLALADRILVASANGYRVAEGPYDAGRSDGSHEAVNGAGSAFGS